MGYKDLNKASLNDDFPLPHVEILVDNDAKSVTYSFIDEFLGYNQIRMAEEDTEKTIFVMPWETFYYKVMSFELRNVDPTSTALKINWEHDTMSFFFNMQFFIRKKILNGVEVTWYDLNCAEINLMWLDCLNKSKDNLDDQ